MMIKKLICLITVLALVLTPCMGMASDNAEESVKTTYFPKLPIKSVRQLAR
mgnify:CR=1 FL=1